MARKPLNGTTGRSRMRVKSAFGRKPTASPFLMISPMAPNSAAVTVILVSLVVAAACGGRTDDRAGGASDRQVRTVTIYVSTDRVFSEPVLKEYERSSQVKVNPVYDTEETKSTGLANRLLAEKDRP